MKTKKYKYLLFAIAILATIISCSDEYLDVEPKGVFLSGNYYANQEQAFSGLVAVYDVMRKNSGGFENTNCHERLEVFYASFMSKNFTLRTSRPGRACSRCRPLAVD